MPEPAAATPLLNVDGWVGFAAQVGPPFVRAILLALGTFIAAKLARSSFNYTARRSDATARLLIGRIINIVIVGLGVATILDTIGVPLTTFVTVVGVAGLGISLAMQDILKSFVAGTYLLFERPFRIGDEISVKDQRGIVEHIGIRTTLMRNSDNVQIIIPNAVVFAEMVANRTNERKSDPSEAGAAAPALPAVNMPAAQAPLLPPGTVPGGTAPGAPGSVPPAAAAVTPAEASASQSVSSAQPPEATSPA